MKKLYFYLMTLMAIFSMTSCDTDEMIADHLCSGNWEGYLGTYYVNRWGESFQDGEFHTVWRFTPSSYDEFGVSTHGYGYEADYSTIYSNEYAYSSFRWEVRNGNIHITYDDPTWNPIRIDWRDYTLTSSRFRGTMYDWENRTYEFDLKNYATWDWSPYTSNRYYTRSGDEDASLPVYVSDNGKSVATGRFAEAMLRMKAATK